MQTRSGGLEPTTFLGIVVPVNESHELGHCIAVVPRRAEGVLGGEPAGRKDDEVGHGGARGGRGGGEDGEDGRIGVVVRDAAEGVEAAEVIFVGVVGAVPGDDVEWSVALRCCKKAAREFGKKGVCMIPGVVFDEGSFGRLEVPCVG